MNLSVTPLNSVSQYIPLSSHHINYLKQNLSREKNSILTWSCFALVVIYLFWFQSDGDFSFLLVSLSYHIEQTLSSIVQSFGFILVLLKVTRTKSVEGLSLKSLVFYFVVLITRFVSVLLSDAYLPYDRSGDLLYRFTEGIGTIAIISLLFSVKKYRFTYYSFIDSFAGVESKKSWKTITLILLSLFCYALLIHPGLSQYSSIDILWSFSHYVEAIAVYPQLQLFSRRRNGEVEPFTSHFVFSLAVSRCLTLLFWISCWRELNANTHLLGGLFAGRSVLLSQILQIIIMTNYVYYYVKSIMNGTPLILPIYRRSREE